MNRIEKNRTRFEEKIVIEWLTGCWRWNAAVHKTVGYGRFLLNGTAEYAHRASWKIYNGEIPPGLHILHNCDFKLCVNPSHLFTGTHQENMADRDRKGKISKPRKKRTHCRRGHEYTEENTATYWHKGKVMRYCRICQRVSWNLKCQTGSGARPKLTAKERFDTKYLIDSNGCWIWNRPVPDRGYGQFCINGSNKPANIASWLIHRGEIPNGIKVLHKCDVMMCVNPDHLSLGTHAQNMADMAAKGRANNGWTTGKQIKGQGQYQGG